MKDRIGKFCAIACVPAILAGLLAVVLPAEAQTSVGGTATSTRRPLAMQGHEGLYQRVILRPGAALFERPQLGAPSRAVPGFSVYYVYGRQADDKWLEVGSTLDGRTEGWVEGVKAIDWRHNLVLAFNNPAGRERAMFFRNPAALKDLWLKTQTRPATAVRYRQEAQAGRDDPVIALEPETFVDITRQFYFLPVLSADQIETERGEKARLLEVISAPAPPAARRPMADSEALRNYKGVVVFVIDTTMSMGPYIDQTRAAVRRVIARMRDTAVRDNFRFGVIAYRDAIQGKAALEYVTKPYYLPMFADSPEKVLENIDKVQEAKVDNQDFDEDAIAGLKVALDKVNWQEFAGRFIILITDAGTRDANDPLSETHLGISEIKALARSEAKQIAISAIHLLTPAGKAVNNHARAERQYKELTEFPGTGSLYYPVPGGSEAEFRSVVDSLTDALLQQVANAVGRPIGGQRPAQTAIERQIAAQSEVVGTAMRLAYLGRSREQTVPDVVRSFVLDEDPVDPKPARKPLDVRVLLTKNQLSDLAKTARTIIEAANTNRLSPQNFFDQVRAAIGATVRDPRRIAESQRLAAMFGDFLRDLPYDSPIMEITPEQWRDGMAPSERREVINALAAKVRLYEELNSQPSLWVSIDGRQGGDTFYPLPIDQLP
jgi:serine/threonine-protein kinase PpkA